MAVSLAELINQAVADKKVNTDGADAGQCTAISHLWEKLNGWPIVLGNAKDTYAEAPAAAYDKTLNTPSNYPLPGAIIVWGPSWGGGFGHTAVVVSANINTFTCLEQNDGDGGVAHVGEHNYAGVIGWFTPKALDHPTVQAPAPNTQFPKTVTITHAVNVRNSPDVTAPVVASLHIGTCVVTAETQGSEGTVGNHTINLWYKTLNGHFFNMAATE